MKNAFRPTLGAALLVAAGHAAAIVGGTPTAAFGVVGSFSTSASGVQITDNWVLTARHVGPAAGAVFSDGFGSAVVAQRYQLFGPGSPQDDLALLRLAAPIDIAPLPINATVLPPGPLATPLDVTIATGANQAPRGYGQTLLQEVIAEVDPDDAGPQPVVPVNWLVAYDAAAGPPYVQAGDSGGGLFLGHVTDSSVLLGTTTAQFADPPTNPTKFGSGFVQFAAYRDWIDATMAADVTDAQMPLWVSSVPEPATLLLWAAGLALIASRRGAGAR